MVVLTLTFAVKGAGFRLKIVAGTRGILSGADFGIYFQLPTVNLRFFTPGILKMSYAIVAGQDFPSLPDCYGDEKRALPASSVYGHANVFSEEIFRRGGPGSSRIGTSSMGSGVHTYSEHMSGARYGLLLTLGGVRYSPGVDGNHSGARLIRRGIDGILPGLTNLV